jgi:hypothetical protein
VLSDRFRPSDPEQRTLEAMVIFLEHIDWEKIYSTHNIPPYDDTVSLFNRPTLETYGTLDLPSTAATSQT